MIRYIDHRKTLIYLSNKEEEAKYEQAILKAAEHILFGQPYEIPERPADKKKKQLNRRYTPAMLAATRFRMGRLHG